MVYSQRANPGDVLLTFVNQLSYFYQCIAYLLENHYHSLALESGKQTVNLSIHSLLAFYFILIVVKSVTTLFSKVETI